MGSLFFLRVFLSNSMLLLPPPSCFSRVRLCETPETAAQQDPPFLGFSRQEHWSGLPFPSPVHKSESEVAQSCPTLSDPMDCSPPGSSIPGILQARVLEWAAIAFSKLYAYICKIHTHIHKNHKFIPVFNFSLPLPRFIQDFPLSTFVTPFLDSKKPGFHLPQYIDLCYG